MTFAAGAGPVWIIRWYWWRINAWSEFAAMIASGIIATWLNLAHGDWLYSQKLLFTVALSAMVWIPVTFLTAPVARELLESFVAKIRPGGRGWRAIAAQASGGPGRALRNWLIALAALFSFNFGLGWLLLR